MLKIYFIYIFGRFCQLVGFDQLASVSYSKIIKHRVFFLDAHKRFQNTYKKSKNKLPIIVYGGVGDILQCLPFMLSYPNFKYIVASHFNGIHVLFRSLNIKTQAICMYKNLSEYDDIKKSLISRESYLGCPRSLFFLKSPFIKQKKLFNSEQKVVGIHIGSSKFAPKKALPKKFLRLLVDQLVTKNFKVIFFSTKEEFQKVQPLRHKNIKYAHDADIIKNLSLVEQCNFFIGSDSAFKTMSCMLKIPTIVLVADDKNSYRDRVFINPYVASRVLTVYKYKAMNDKVINIATKFIINRLIISK